MVAITTQVTRKLTRQSEDDDLLVRPFLGGVVVNRDAAGGDLAGLFGPGDIPGEERLLVREGHDGRGVLNTHEKTTSLGKLSPTWGPLDMVNELLGCWIEELKGCVKVGRVCCCCGVLWEKIRVASNIGPMTAHELIRSPEIPSPIRRLARRPPETPVA